jgi:TRAP-type C4-dicarboxylate transport system substrate-binding protein
MKLVTQFTKGEVKFDYGFGAVYGAPAQIPSLLAAGTIDLATTAASFAPDLLPSMAFLNAPAFIFSSAAQAKRVADALFRGSSLYQNEANAIGSRFLWTHVNQPYYFWGNKTDCTLEGLKGTKARGFGAFMPAAEQAIGITPVNVLSTELYTSLQRGIIDWMLIPADSYVASKLYEVGKNLCTASLGGIVGPQIYMSLKTWNKLGPAIQAALTKAGQMASARDASLAARAQENALRSFKNVGGKLLVFPEKDQTEWIRRAPDAIGGWVALMTDKGKGKEATAAAKIIKTVGGPFKLDTTIFTKIWG